jgi:DNA mismatch repair protein MutH
MFKAFTIAAVAASLLLSAAPAEAQYVRGGGQVRIQPIRPPMRQIRPPLQNLLRIRPSQAAAIALGENPGAKVVGVKLLPSGVYAVTLRDDYNVMRVMVDGNSGAVF